MIQNIQNTEIFSTENCNYLLIHKNACTQILYTLRQNSEHVNFSPYLPLNHKPYWTVIRDPYERFLSGLTYDIKKVYGGVEKLEELLNTIDLKNLFLNKVNKTYRSSGHAVHTLPQWTYLFNQPINFFVHINNLTLFLDTHFKIKVERKNSADSEDIQFVRQYIESNKTLKANIDIYLAPDYFLYNHIVSENLIWEWNYGKMF
jgi:hypothetical protein